MLSKLSIRNRVLALPILAAVGLVLLLVTNVVLGMRYAASLTEIHSGHVPALSHSMEMEALLKEMQRTAQDAVAAEDLESLAALKPLETQFLTLLTEQLQNPVLPEEHTLALRSQFTAYAAVLNRSSEDMIRRDYGLALVTRMEELKTSFASIRDTLQLQSTTARKGVKEAFERSSAAQRDANLGFALICVFWLGALGALSAFIGRSVSEPLAVVASSAKSVAQEIASSVHQQSTSVQETATSVSEASTTIDELRQTSEMTSRKSQGVMRVAEESLQTADTTLESVQAGNAIMVAIQDEVTGIAESILDLSEKHIEIGEIVETVNGIAEQSNLLAVNASIEAAKAGEAGRGFAVVAAEVKALAGRSREATRQIRSLLAEIQKSSNSAVMITEQGTKRVEEGGDLIRDLGHSIEAFRGVIEESAEMARQISLATEQQQSGLEQITQAMRAIDTASRESASGAIQLEGAARRVLEVSNEVTAVVHGMTDS